MSKKYRVEITPEAEHDIRREQARIALDKPAAANKWAAKVRRAIRSLDRFPHRCEVIPEPLRSPVEYRQLILGNYRIIYEIQSARVIVHRVYPAARILWHL